ncbi:MAG TPA: hypothetical protein ENF26_03365 [Methanomicrobia archaeon]|nr:hypothetical protein [Methanomicrobia archaeon]HEX59170.1 hypothetical protein [Methanomicrobia archaeon]
MADEREGEPFSSLLQDERYVTKIAYPHLLFIQMQRVMDALRAGGDGLEELENLKALLLQSWRREINEELNGAEEAMRRRLAKLQKLKSRLGTATFREARRRVVVEYVRAYVREVVEKLNEVGLLLVEEHRVLRGGGLVE